MCGARCVRKNHDLPTLLAQPLLQGAERTPSDQILSWCRVDQGAAMRQSQWMAAATGEEHRATIGIEALDARGTNARSQDIPKTSRDPAWSAPGTSVRAHHNLNNPKSLASSRSEYLADAFCVRSSLRHRQSMGPRFVAHVFGRCGMNSSSESSGGRSRFQLTSQVQSSQDVSNGDPKIRVAEKIYNPQSVRPDPSLSARPRRTLGSLASRCAAWSNCCSLTHRSAFPTR